MDNSELAQDRIETGTDQAERQEYMARNDSARGRLLYNAHAHFLLVNRHRTQLV